MDWDDRVVWESETSGARRSFIPPPKLAFDTETGRRREKNPFCIYPIDPKGEGLFEGKTGEFLLRQD